MGSAGKVYPKSRMRDLLSHFGTIDKVAGAVRLNRGTVSRIAAGNTTHAPTRDKLNKVLTRIRAARRKKKAKAKNGNSKYHCLTKEDVSVLKALVEKFEDKAYKKLGVSPEGFKLIIAGGVGKNVMKKTQVAIEKAKKFVFDEVAGDVNDNGSKVEFGFLLKKLRQEPVQEDDTLNSILARIEGKINALIDDRLARLETQNQVDQQLKILDKKVDNMFVAWGVEI